MRLLMLFVLSLTVIASCNTHIEEDDEAEKEGDEAEVLQSFDLWSAMRTYPNKVMDASSFSPGYEMAQGMSISAKSDALQMDLPTTAPWSELAPLNFAGRILCVAIHPTIANTMFVGSASGGLWKTTTGGTGGAGGISWQNVPTGFPVLGVASIAFNPTNGNEMYIGTGEVYSVAPPATGTIGHGGPERLYRGSYGIGILKTTDGGASWTKVLNFSASNLKGVSDILIHPTNTQIVFAATTDGIYRTTNGGTTWSLIHNVVLANKIEFQPGNPDVLYAGVGNLGSTGSGIYKSTNANAVTPTFIKLGGGLPTTISGKIEIAVTPVNTSYIYASIGNSPLIQTDPEGLYRSTDGGTTWTLRNTNTTVIGGQGWYGHDIAVGRTNANLVLWGELNFFRSTDGGTNITQTGTWSNWNVNNTTVGTLTEGSGTGYVHADVHAIVASPYDATGNTFFICTDGGLFRTTNGGSNFNTLNGGLNTSQIYSNAAISATDRNYMILGLQDNEAFVYGGTPGCKRIPNLGDGFHAAINPTNDNIGFMESYFLRVKKTTNRTTSWGATLIVNGSGTTPAEPTCFNGPYVLAPSNPNIFYGGTVRVKKSTNINAATPTITDANGGNVLAGANNPIISMTVAPSTDQVVYASTVPAGGIRSKLWKTTNGATSFTDITGTLPDRYYSKIAVDPIDPNRVAVVLSGFGSSHVFISTNGGTSWCDIGGGLPDVPHNTLTFDPDNNTTLYVGNDLGVFYAGNIPTGPVGSSYSVPWTAYNDGFPDGVLVSDIVVTPAPRKLRLATFGRGLWERDMGPMISLPFNTISLQAKRLSQDNELLWKVTGESNISRYEVEYSSNGRDFTFISSLNARNIAGQQTYSFMHNISMQKDSYYRIKIIDVDGAVKYSSTEVISADKNIPVFKVYPNPAANYVFATISITEEQDAQYIIYDMRGSRMAVKSVKLLRGNQDIKIDISAFASGSYRLVLVLNGQKKSTTIIKK